MADDEVDQDLLLFETRKDPSDPDRIQMLRKYKSGHSYGVTLLRSADGMFKLSKSQGEPDDGLTRHTETPPGNAAFNTTKFDSKSSAEIYEMFKRQMGSTLEPHAKVGMEAVLDEAGSSIHIFSIAKTRDSALNNMHALDNHDTAGRGKVSEIKLGLPL